MLFLSETNEGKKWVHVLCFNAYFEDALAKNRARTGLGDTYAILNSLNEYWHQTGDMTDEGYEYNKQRYSETLIQHLKKNLQSENELSEVKAKPILKEKPKKTYVDYSKLSDDELLERYRNAIRSNDVVEPNIIQFEAKKRGYQFKEDYDGNVEVVNIKKKG